MRLQGKTLIIGSGKSGISSAGLLFRNGCEYALFDSNESLSVDEIRSRSEALKDNSVNIYLGDMSAEDIKGFERAVVSPGVPLDTDIVVKCRENKVDVIGEIELAYLFSKGRIAAITGTNGKTTTVTLIGELLKKQFEDVYVAGNIGDPYTDIADKTTDKSVTVLEISSFQLETIDKFHVNVSAFLNLTPDHLDRHKTMENYAAAKERVANLGTEDDVCVLNASDEWAFDFSKRCPARPVFFSSSKILDDGFYLDEKMIVRAKDGNITKIMDVRDMNLVGVCNAENVMAALAVGEAFGMTYESMVEVISSFKAVPHRIEYSGTVKGVRYYNDSKGTNPDAAVQGIRAMDAPTYLIAGGYDKKIPFDEWVEAFDGKVKKLVLIGQTAQIIADTCEKYGFKNYAFADSFEEAFNICASEASDGENVLLSPACASWGMFKNYEERGDLFKKLVKNLM